MSKRLRRASHYLLIGTLFVSLGGHLVLLQTLAWGNMLMSFSRTESITEAAKMTFDGEHPCELCKAVKQTKKEEEKKPLLKSEAKLEIILPASISLKTPIGIPVVVLVPGYSGSASDVSLGVPLQPPRVA